MGEYCAKTLFVKGGPDEVKRDFSPDGITISREVKIFESNMGTILFLFVFECVIQHLPHVAHKELLVLKSA